MKETYRFLSLDPLYCHLTHSVRENQGVQISKESYKESWLYHGNVYKWGKANGREFPSGSFDTGHGNIRTSFPAELEIITESSDKLVHLEKEWEIPDDVPRNSRSELKPSDDWDARHVEKKKK